MIRALGRRGYRVIAADSQPGSIGFRCRFARDSLVYASAESQPDAVVETLYQAARRRAVDLIVPVTDTVLLPLSRSRHRFDGWCRLAIPAAAALETVTNKVATIELAASQGVPVPRTCVVRTVDEARRAAGELGWPVVLKPQSSRIYHTGGAVESYRVSYASDAGDLARQMAAFEGRCAVLLQQYCPGVAYGVELLLHAGRPLAAFQHRRLREVPVQGGVSTWRESVPLEPVLLDYAVRMLGALAWTGLAMVEFKSGPHGIRLMEINGRVWGSMPLAVHCGMDFPGRLADLYLHGPPAAGAAVHATYAVGVRARNLELDLKWIATVLAGRSQYRFLPLPSRWAAMRALIGLLDPRCHNDTWAWDDPWPGIADLPRIARKLLGKLIGPTDATGATGPTGPTDPTRR
jgi:predicted ATP-grasp superfamily ATP-dependent carboligase